MPVLRSQRSKPSKRRVEEEMAPPEDASPPKTRTTRSKKVSKKEEVAPSEVPKSPTPSSSSTRSTRTRTRSKVPPVEEVEVASPPKTRPTRSTRQKTTATVSKASKSSAKIEKESVTDDAASAPGAAVVAPTPSTSGTKTKGKKTTAKKAKAKPKKVKKEVETASEDVTEEESDMEPKEKKLTLKQLHKNYVAPLKTVMDGAVCEVYPQVTKTIMDETAAKDQEKKFQELLSCTSLEMPPPAVPAAKKPKGKGRQKRARSPEKTPVKMEVPESFNFAVNGAESHVPATKKIIMDAPTPETEENVFEQSAMEVDDDNLDSDKAEAVSGADTTYNKEVSQESQVKEVVDPKHNLEESNTKHTTSKQNEEPETKPLSKEDGEVKTKPISKKKDAEPKTKALDKQDEESKTKALNKQDEEPRTKALGKQDEEPKPLSKQDKEPKTKPLSKQDKEPKTKPPSKQDEEPKTKPLSKQDEEPKTKPLSKQDEEPKTKLLSKKEAEAKIKPIGKQGAETKITPFSKQDDEIEVKSLDSHDSKKTTTVDTEKKSVVLDETYVFETPKDDKKEKEMKLNSTFTPELFVDTTPKSRPVAADTTIVISKSTEKDNKEIDVVVLEDSVLAPASPEPENTSDAASSANGLVSSLVNFFDKNKKELGSNMSKTPSKTDNVDLDKNTSVPTKNDSVEKVCADNNDLNSTYVLPTTKKTNSSSMMNVTVCVKKASTPEDEGEKHIGLKPIMPPASLLIQSNNSRFMHDSPASRTFVKEPPSLAVVMEEDDERKDAPKATKPSEKTKAVATSKLTQKEKEPSSKKGVSSSSSSSSCSSMKSASSQPCLLSASKKPPSGMTKNGPNYGSAGKLNEVVKSKTLEDAEKRRQELLQQKAELTKKKREEWLKKTEKNKLEEEKRFKEKQKVIQPISSSVVMKKPTPLVGKTGAEGGIGALGFPKPKYNFGPSTSKMPNQNLPLPLSKNPYHKPPSNEVDMDESFKSAHNSFLDQTTEGHLSSYDITVYEDLDDDLKHRENKTLPTWASDKEALKTALFSMVLLPDYEHKLTGGFPKPDKTYKLFPSTRIGHGHQ